MNRSCIGLFFETCRNLEQKKHAKWTLKHRDLNHVLVDGTVKFYPSLYKLYMEEMDITEYLFATKHFDTFKAWKNLVAKKWFHDDHLLLWREDLDIKLRSLALSEVIKNGTLNANKFLLEGKYLPKGMKDDITPSEKKFRDKKIVEAVVNVPLSNTSSVSDYERILGKKEMN